MSDEQQQEQSTSQPGQWWIKVPAGQFGPVDLSTVQQWAQQRRLTPNDFVYNPEAGAWVPAGGLPQLAGYFPLRTPGGVQPPGGPQALGGYQPPGGPRPVAGPYPGAPMRAEKRGTNSGCVIGAVVAAVVGFIGLAILAGMLLPALARAREQARRASCLSNIKQLGLAAKQYTQDFNHVYPWRKAVDSPKDAWCDLGLLYPNYCSGSKAFFCPSAKDRPFTPDIEVLDGRPSTCANFSPVNTRRVISYSYCYDSSKRVPAPWTENAKSTVRIMADKKAGIEIDDSNAALANHKDDGRNVLYNDGHVKWKAGPDGLDPDPDNNAIGRPYTRSYTDWWSDPPWYEE
jgi:prepilin-type processing-associated H-X9-DG protein